MSLNIITKSIDNIVTQYIQKISKKYNLKNEDLLKDWNSNELNNDLSRSWGNERHASQIDTKFSGYYFNSHISYFNFYS